MGHYIANLRDIEFCLFDLLGREKLLGTSLYSDLDRDTAMGMLEEIKRITENDLAASFVDGRVLKVTKSGAEYEIAKRLIGSKYDGIVEYFAAEKVGGSYYLLMEELDPIDDDEFNEAVGMLASQELPITYLDHFDEDEYEESHGKAPDMSFLNELWEVLFDLRKAGIGERADIRADNLGRDSSGKLKAFDVMERG